MKRIIETYLVLWLCAVSAAAYLMPGPFLWWREPLVAGVDAPWNQSRLWYLIAATMLAIGWLLPRDELLQVARRWPTVLAGTAVQYLTMPALAWGIARLMGLEGASLVGVIMVGCVPGAMASNVLTLVAGGNVSYSLSLTTMATLLSPLVVPAALELTLGRVVDFPATQTGITLAGFVVLPVIVGFGIKRALPRTEAPARTIGPIVANLAILLVIAVVVAANRDRIWNSGALVVAALAAINAGGYLAGYLGGRLIRLDRPMRRALTLEVGMQNAGLGTTLALTLFPGDSGVAVPTALYTFGCMFTGTVLARLWAQRESVAVETAAEVASET